MALTAETELSFKEVPELPNETAQDSETPGDTPPDGEAKGDQSAAPNLDELFKDEPTGDQQPDVFAQHGVDATNVASVTKQAKAFTAMTTLLGTNPALLLGELEKANPTGFDAFMDAAAQLYEQRFGQQQVADIGDGSKSNGVNTQLLNRIKALESKLEGRDIEEQQANAARGIQEVKQNYESKRDGFIAKVPNLSARDQRAIRALVNEEVAQDKATQQRLMSGNYGDVLRVVKKVVTEYLTDSANDAKTKQAKREVVQNTGVKPLGTGASATGGEQVSDADSWDTAVDSLANSLLKASKK